MTEITLFFYVQMQDTSMSRPFIKCLLADKILLKKNPSYSIFKCIPQKCSEIVCVYTHSHIYKIILKATEKQHFLFGHKANC